MRQRIQDAAGRFDAAIERAFDLIRGNPTADRVFYAASEAGDFSLLWHTIGTGRVLLPGGRDTDAVRLSALLGVESILVNGLLKSLTARARPVEDDKQERPHHLRIPLTSSFPSGHASSAFMAASLLAERDRMLAPLYYGVAAVVAASRIHVRIHHGTDVVAGAALGLALGAAGRRIWRLVR